MTPTTTTRFPLGKILATPGALRVMQEAGENPIRLLRRHAHGDWGDLHPFDVDANERALRQGLRILGVYVLSSGERVWIITEAELRAATTILTPEEY